MLFVATCKPVPHLKTKCVISAEQAGTTQNKNKNTSNKVFNKNQISQYRKVKLSQKPPLPIEPIFQYATVNLFMPYFLDWENRGIRILLSVLIFL